MSKAIIFGLDGTQYENFVEAWDSYWVAAHGDTQFSAEDYHIERKAFLCGAIACINVLSVRINQLAEEPISVQKQMHTAIMTTLTEAMQHASDEFEWKKKG